MEPLFYRIIRPIVTLLVKIVFRPTYKGLEYIPKEGAVVLGGNHTSNFDCILLLSSTKRVIHFLAKDSLNKGLKKIIFGNLGIIPVNRLIHDKDALKNAIITLEENKVVGIFPESTINKTDDAILPFKIGCVKMAHDTQTNIVPFVIKGKYKPFSKGIQIEFFPPYIPTSDNLTAENEKLMDLISSNLKEKRN